MQMIFRFWENLKRLYYIVEKRKKMVFGRFVVFTTTLVWTLQWWFHIITSNSHSSHSDSWFDSTFDSNSLRPPIPDSQFDSNSLRFPIPDSTLDSNSLRLPIPDAKFGTWSPWPAPSLTWFRNRLLKLGPVLRNSGMDSKLSLEKIKVEACLDQLLVRSSYNLPYFTKL